MHSPTTRGHLGSLVEVPVLDEGWARFVDSRRDALAFHHPSWAATLSATYRYPVRVLVALDGSGGVVGGVPVLEVSRWGRRPRWVSLPFTDTCPPLGFDDWPPETLVAALERARGEAQARQLEVRSELPGAQPGAASWGHVLRLGAEESTYQAFHAGQVRRNIRRAERCGVVVRRAVEERDLAETFYRLHVLTRHRLGVPVQPRRYFGHLWRQMLRTGRGFLLIAEVGGEAAAAAVFLHHGDTVIYKYGASDPALLSARPNHLLFWEAIRWSCRERFRYFDFGRTDLADEGLRQFKLRWGATERRLSYSILADHRVTPTVGAPGVARTVVRRSPVAVTRLLGEVLYRYTA
jgi:CelD/BcsL family acetyltransferase involved in cellulose biosynthesis